MEKTILKISKYPRLNYLEPCMILRTPIMVTKVRGITLPRLSKVPRKYLR